MKTNPNCKINLGLHVVSRRADGYHNLESVFLPVPICDELEINLSSSFSFIQDGIAIEGDAEQNLVVRAYRMMQQAFGDLVGAVDIRLTKNIPFGAGLGGGSSNAAFTLKMLNDLFSLNMSSIQLQQLSTRLGADCAFFVDNVPAYVTGIGDQLSPLDFNPLEGHKLLLVKPDETVSTTEAYRGITPRDRRQHCPTASLLQAIRRPMSEWQDLIVNDFEESVFKGHSFLGEIKSRLYAAGALYAAMSGSGSTVYGIFPLSANLRKVADHMSHYGQLFFLE